MQIGFGSFLEVIVHGAISPDITCSVEATDSNLHRIIIMRQLEAYYIPCCRQFLFSQDMKNK